MLLSAKHGLEIAAPPPNPNGATVSDNIATGELPIQAQYSLRKTARGGGGEFSMHASTAFSAWNMPCCRAKVRKAGLVKIFPSFPLGLLAHLGLLSSLPPCGRFAGVPLVPLRLFPASLWSVMRTQLPFWSLLFRLVA